MFWFRRDVNNAKDPDAEELSQHKDQLEGQKTRPSGGLQLATYTKRRYRTDVPYFLPSDIEEAKRLDFQHFIMRSALGKSYTVPRAGLVNAQMMLDVGSGTNIWGHEICREFMAAQVYGFDLEFTARPEAPQNYHFVEGDVLRGLPFPKDSFDFVHQRFMAYAIPVREWQAVVDRMVAVTIPRGWIELIEMGGEHFKPAGPITAQMVDSFHRISMLNGIDTRLMGSLETVLEHAGLINVHKKVVPLPVGKWGGRIGSLMATNMTAVMAALKEPCMKALRYTPDYFDKLVVTMGREWEEYHSQYPVYLYYAQKP